MEWINIGKIDVVNHHGFVYKITNIKTGKIYVGRKILKNTTKTKIGVREKAATKTRKTYKQVVKESNWRTYCGSNKDLINDIKANPQDFQKEILETAETKKYLGYLELKYQFQFDVLKCDSYNGNMNGSYYRKDME